MTYLLDTNVIVATLRDRPTLVRERLRAVIHSKTPLVVSAVALFELWYGVARSDRRQENADRLRSFLSGDIEVVAFEAEDAVIAGRLRADLDAASTPIGPYDLLIAAQALRLRAVLVTANVIEFARVHDLRWEDWTHSAPKMSPPPD